MKQISIIFSISLFCLSAKAQFIYSLESTPDSAAVLISGKEECRTPCDFSFYWKQYKNDKLVIEIAETGYQSWSDTLHSKPRALNFEENVELERSYPKFAFDTLTAPVAFDKLLADVFTDGEKIGTIRFLNGAKETLKWEGSVKTGAPQFEEVFYNVLEEAGYQTPKSIQTKIQLFKPTETVAPPPPRFLVGLKLKAITYSIQEVERNKRKEYISLVKMQCEWQVLDKTKDQVIITYQNEGTYKSRNSRKIDNIQNLPPFEDALIDFLANSGLYEIVKDSRPVFSTYASAGANPDRIYKIDEVLNPQFDKLSDMIQYVNPSCVTIITDRGFGSGVIITEEGLLLTAYHVVKESNRINVQFSSGIKLGAELIVYDEDSDIAMLNITGSGYQPLPLSAAEVKLGEDLITIGTPSELALGQSVSKGIVSGKRMNGAIAVLQIDMAVSPGNSGGPLLNDNGEVVGIVQRKIFGGGVEGIGFGIPIPAVIDILHLELQNKSK